MPPRDGLPPALVRIVEGLTGSVEVDCTLVVRFGYGQVMPWMRRTGGQLLGVAGPDAVWLATPVTLTGRNCTHQATFTVQAGQRVPFVLSYMPSYQGVPEQCDPDQALAATTRFWSDWVSRCTYQGRYRDAVVRSLITLKALTYQPTGGIVAAATTSLPEDLGGVRNWDYRYCWLRDATITLEALLRTGYTDEAGAWRAWLARTIAGDPSDVQIMYGVAGERRLAEWEADWLPGYAQLRAGADRQRRGEPAPARRVRRGHRRADARPRVRPDGGPACLVACSGRCSASWRSTGTSRTRASGRYAARGGTSCTPR